MKGVSYQLCADGIPICVWEGWLDVKQDISSASLGGHHLRLVEKTFMVETEILHYWLVLETEQGTGKEKKECPEPLSSLLSTALSSTLPTSMLHSKLVPLCSPVTKQILTSQVRSAGKHSQRARSSLTSCEMELLSKISSAAKANPALSSARVSPIFCIDIVTTMLTSSGEHLLPPSLQMGRKIPFWGILWLDINI